MFGTKLSFATARRTASAVSSVTSEEPSRARETVATDTPAWPATSRIVAGFLGPDFSAFWRMDSVSATAKSVAELQIATINLPLSLRDCREQLTKRSG